MPDFTARMTAGGALVPWVDTPTATRPSRLNPNPAHLPTYLKVAPGATVTFKAKVGGVEGPMDAALGGRLFQVAWAEWSGPYPPAIVQAPGQSSVATITLTAQHLGHFLFWMGRVDGGAVAIHFNVEP